MQILLTAVVKRGVIAIGDLISGEVTKEVRGPVAIPSGAEVTLRITRMESRIQNSRPVQVVAFGLVRVKARGPPV